MFEKLRQVSFFGDKRGDERRVQALMEALDVVVWEADLKNTHFSFVSQRAEDIFGYPTTQWLTEEDFWNGHIHPEDREAAMLFRRSAVAEGRDHNHEYRMLSANGRWLWVRDRVRVMRDHDGHPKGLLGVMRDITERRHNEDALKESVRRFREMLENVNLIAVGLDLEGRITLCNDFLLGLTGWQRDEVMGKSWFEIFLLPEDRKPARAVFDEMMRGERLPSQRENRIVTRSGKPRVISWSNGVLRDLRGAIVGITSIGEDITERKRLEDQFRQVQKMEALGRLTGGVAHDFNNLLTAIMGYNELLLLGLETESRLRRNAEEIQKAAERAAALTQQLLAFSRKQVLKPQVIDLNVVVVNMDKILRRLMGGVIQFQTRLAPDLGRIRADAGQIEQVIMNLVLNARDAVAQGGRIVIETRNEEASPAKGTAAEGESVGWRRVVLSVRDNGCGMDENTLSHLFEPFFTTKEVGKGTGLGLSTIYGIVQQSGGNVEVFSQPGQGTCFEIILPRVDDELSVLPLAGDSLHSVRGSETILVVEDEAYVRQLIQEVLTSAGYQVLEATHGQQAFEVAMAHEGVIHLLIADVVMPGMEGGELARRMEGVRPDMKVLFISGHAGTDSSRISDIRAAVNFLQKPFSPNVLKHRVRQILDGGDSERQ